MNRNSSVSIVMDYGQTDEVQFPTGVRNVSLLYSIQTGSASHPASYPTHTGEFFPQG
jgi:hypothetical protein